MKKNITILCLAKNFSKNIAKIMADKMEMMYADVEKILEYNMINQDMLLSAGQEYFDSCERGTLKTVSSYENSILTVNFSTLNKGDNLSLLKNNSLLILIDMSKEQYEEIMMLESDKDTQKINLEVFEQRTEILKKYADIILKTETFDVENVIKEILKNIGQYFEN